MGTLPSHLKIINSDIKNTHVHGKPVCISLKLITEKREGMLCSGYGSSHCVGKMLMFPRSNFREKMQVIDWEEN